MSAVSKLQEYAADFFANMSISELTANNPWVTTKAYAEVGECEDTADSFTDIQFAWEEAMERAIKKANSDGCGWMVLRQHQFAGIYRTTYVQANDEVTVNALKEEKYEIEAEYKNFAEWADVNAKDPMKNGTIPCFFYIHNCRDRHYEISSRINYELSELA